MIHKTNIKQPIDWLSGDLYLITWFTQNFCRYAEFFRYDHEPGADTLAPFLFFDTMSVKDKEPFFRRPLFRFLVQPEVISEISSITADDIFAYYQKEYPNDNDNLQKIYNALAKDLEEVLDAGYFNTNTTNVLRNIRDTWSVSRLWFCWSGFGLRGEGGLGRTVGHLHVRDCRSLVRGKLGDCRSFEFVSLGGL